MTKYIVHLYREMRLCYKDIEADSPEAAAAIASNKATDDADNVEDCEGENLAALIDAAGDDDFSQSVTIDFDAERQRKAAAKLLVELVGISDAWSEREGGSEVMDYLERRLYDIRDAITQATSSGISPVPATSALLASLEAILPYAENEANSLEELKDSPQAEAEAEKAWRAVETAQAVIAEAKAASISLAKDGIDIDALLAARRQIAVIWTVEDVQEVRPDLSDDQAWELLQVAEDSHEADIGINHGVLEAHAAMLFGDAPETDESKEA